VEMNFLQNAIPVVNVYHVKVGHTPTVDDLSDVTDAFAGWWEEKLRLYLNVSLVLQNITTTSLDEEDGIQLIFSDFTNPQGAVTSDAAAANAAYVISWRSSRIGRSYRGRTYLGGLNANSLLSAQLVTTGFQDLIVESAQDLLDRLEAISAVLVIVSRIAAGIVRVVAAVTEIVSFVCDQKIDSQRRRTAN
jgi:hypothetical protein